jgi:hypothetical protein
MTDFDSATHGALGKGKSEPRQVVVRGKTQVISRSEASNAGMRKAERGIRNSESSGNVAWTMARPGKFPRLFPQHSAFRIPSSAFTIPAHREIGPS